MLVANFNPKIKTVGQISNPVRPFDSFKYEPMLFGADWTFARQHGGPLTNEVLDKLIHIPEFIEACPLELEDNLLDIVIDTRITMTMAGAYPSIPGWHCDDVPRGSNGQPVLNKRSNRVQHFMCLLASVESQSCTEFLTDNTYFFIDTDKVWYSLDTSIKEHTYLKTRFIKQGEIVQFNQHSIHRASPTTNPGWRFFFRASITHRKPINVQIYLTKDNGGW